MNFNEGVNAPINNILQSTQQDEVIGLSAMSEGDPAGKVEIGSSESVSKETHANVFMDKNGEVGAAVSTSFPDNFMVISRIHFSLYLYGFLFLFQ